MSDVDSASSSEAGYSDQGVGDRTVMAVVPVSMQTPKKPKKQTPQEAIDEFWKKFTTKAPGKGSYPHCYTTLLR